MMLFFFFFSKHAYCFYPIQDISNLDFNVFPFYTHMNVWWSQTEKKNYHSVRKIAAYNGRSLFLQFEGGAKSCLNKHLQED